MIRRSREETELAWVSIGSDVVRKIRQHARSSTATEVCGVLIGTEGPDGIEVDACIRGLNAEQAGAHVTFTQDTWEHIYKIKDQQYPSERILGWYHSHPGFGIFLSEHDTFIHKNFFSSPRQVAWVFDPHSEEEGCFGWVRGRIERLPQIRVIDRQSGESAEKLEWIESEVTTPISAPLAHFGQESDVEDTSEISLRQLVTTILSHLSVLLLGFVIGWYLFPRVVLVPVPIDPRTGQPLEMPQMEQDRPGLTAPGDSRSTSPQPSDSDKSTAGKAPNEQRR